MLDDTNIDLKYIVNSDVVWIDDTKWYGCQGIQRADLPKYSLVERLVRDSWYPIAFGENE